MLYSALKYVTMLKSKHVEFKQIHMYYSALKSTFAKEIYISKYVTERVNRLEEKYRFESSS